jgi:hypothetical protein
LALARQRAAEAVANLTTTQVDLEHGNTFPRTSYDLVLSNCYLNRALLGRSSELLASGGTLVVIQPTRRNLERHEKPPRDFLLDEGELPRLVTGVDVLHYEEGWLADERHDAVLVGRRA